MYLPMYINTQVAIETMINFLIRRQDFKKEEEKTPLPPKKPTLEIVRFPIRSSQLVLVLGTDQLSSEDVYPMEEWLTKQEHLIKEDLGYWNSSLATISTRPVEVSLCAITKVLGC